MTAVDELLLDSPAARPCQHPRANHQHGTLMAYKRDGCRCFPCRLASSRYLAARKQAINYGRWNVWVDAEPMRAYVEQLMDATGIDWKSVARRGHLAPQTVYRLLYGDPTKKLPPAKRLHRTTVLKLLSVQVGPVRPVPVPDLLTMKEAAV